MPMHGDCDIVMANPSVRLSVTLWYCIKTNAHIVKLFPSPGSGIILVLLSAAAITKFQGEPFQRMR